MAASQIPHRSAAGRNQLHYRFLSILPRIKTHARIYFRHVKCCFRKADFISEVVALVWKWFVRLAERGKDACRFPSVLASYAVKAVHSGRRVCGQLPAKDVLSERAQQMKDFRVSSLPMSTRIGFDSLNRPGGQQQLDEFEERLQDNRVTPVPEQVAFRLDFPAWTRTRTQRDRRLIRDMGRNERTKDLSRKYGLSQARISQLRREFKVDYNHFTADPADA